MASNLPDYVASAKPVPQADRKPWYTNTAQTYAGIMLWFVFWQEIPLGKGIHAGSPFSMYPGGMLSQGLLVPILAVILAALFCHFLFYVVPGLLGMKTGLPLYIVGTSTYGVHGGFAMPGFFMGVLQFGWLGVNSYFSSLLIANTFGFATNSAFHFTVGTIWALVAAFVGLKGIQYVARVATFLPILPFVILLILFFATVGGVANFDPQPTIDAGKAEILAAEKAAGASVEADAGEEQAETEATPEEAADVPLVAEEEIPSEEAVGEAGAANAPQPLGVFSIFAVLSAYIVGFFATAGAAGADFGMNNRDEKDVQLGGLVGIAGATIFTGVLALLIVAGATGGGMVENAAVLSVPQLMGSIVGENTAKVFQILLVVAAFPPACFSSLIAANSFKTTLPKVNPFISCGIGTLGSIILVISTKAGDAAGVFGIIGASFGPICGAMMADYILAGFKWPGPRAGFNLAGWISWAVGFLVGTNVFGLIPGFAAYNPCPPMGAFIVGFVLYAILAKAGLEGKTLEMPAAEEA